MQTADSKGFKGSDAALIETLCFTPVHTQELQYRIEKKTLVAKLSGIYVDLN